jgi:hypothetical protein
MSVVRNDGDILVEAVLLAPPKSLPLALAYPASVLYKGLLTLSKTLFWTRSSAPTRVLMPSLLLRKLWTY